jgi:serine protease AprX
LKFTSLKSAFVLCLIVCFGSEVFSQTRYRIYFKDKFGTEYNPYTYLHSKALERRFLHHLNLCDTSDFPVNEKYLAEVIQLSDSIIGISRWMNAIFVFTNYEKYVLIKKLPFVMHTEVISESPSVGICEEERRHKFDTSINNNGQQLLKGQIDRMQGKLLKANYLDGQGVRIAILDAGFKSYSTNPVFEHIRKRYGIIATYDFVKKRENTDIGMSHGTNVFSCLGGELNNYQFGLATAADYLLARTESRTEFFSEEENWLLAAEWADKNGADIINSSLGYTFQRYLPENMDGKTTFITRAAQMAVDKGILVVSSAGNEGNKKWKRVAAPGDAEGVLTVGAIDPSTGIKSNFSSFGPSSDKRLKPEISAYGTACVADNDGFSIVNGTSFSSPLVAGFAACIKQKYPTLKNTELKEFICHSGDLWPYFDYAHGYGVPQPYFLFKDTLENKATLSIIEDTFDITLYPIEWDTALYKNANDSLLLTNDSLSLSDASAYLNSQNIENEKDLNKENINYFYKTATPDLLFYHIKNKKGYLDKYYVLDLKDDENGSVSISKNIADKPFTIGIYYKGYFKELIIKE